MKANQCSPKSSVNYRNVICNQFFISDIWTPSLRTVVWWQAKSWPMRKRCTQKNTQWIELNYEKKAEMWTNPPAKAKWKRKWENKITFKCHEASVSYCNATTEIRMKLLFFFWLFSVSCFVCRCVCVYFFRFFCYFNVNECALIRKRMKGANLKSQCDVLVRFSSIYYLWLGFFFSLFSGVGSRDGHHSNGNMNPRKKICVATRTLRPRRGAVNLFYAFRHKSCEKFVFFFRRWICE